MAITTKVYKDYGGDEEIVASSGKITVQSGGELEIESGGQITAQSGGEIEIESGGKIALEDGGLVNIGTGIDGTATYNATRQVFEVKMKGDFLSTVGLSDRIKLTWVAGAHGKPGLNADIQNAAEATRMITDPWFEVLGTNASSDDVTYNAEGGITFTTDGADGDGVILLPHLDTNQSPWAQITWGTDQETRYECLIETGADITNSIVWAGLKLTNTDVVATDDDQCYFRYENGVNSGKWQAVSSIGGSDDASDSGVTVAASTKYHFVIDIQSDRTALMYINGVLVETSAALTDATDFIPYIAVEADGAAEAKTLTIYGAEISRNAGA